MTHRVLLKALTVVGLAAMLIGSLDPLEGSVLIAPGLGLAALAAFLGRTKRRKLVYASAAMVAVGVAAMFVLSAYGGVGGRHGQPWWWAVTMLPYPVGWISGWVGAILTTVEFFKQPVEAGAAKA